MIFRRFLLIFVTAFALAACGGGGGGSSSSGGSGSGGGGAVETDTLTLSTGAVNFTATEFESVPEPISVTASITGSNTAGIVFGTLPDVEGLPVWLDVQLGELINNTVDASFIIMTTGIPDGTYSFTIRAVTYDSNQAVLDTADIEITFTLNPGIPLSVSPESVDVVMHYTSETVTEVVSVTAGNYEWFASSADVGVTPGTATGSADISLTILPAMKDMVDDSGQYQGTVEVFQNNSSNNALYAINYTMFPTLESASDEVFLNSVSGSTTLRTVGVNLIGQGLNWQASADVDWLTFSDASGTITSDDLEIGTPAGEDFSVSVDASRLDAGRYDAVITVTAEAEQSIEIPVAIEIAPQELFPSKRGIAFSQTATTSILQATVDVSSNIERNANWTATSNVSWLSVTSAGTVADPMMVFVDPTGLLDEVFSEGSITLASPDEEIVDTQIIRVGFWKSAQTPSDTPVMVGSIFPEDLIVPDPIRPLAYVHSGETEINIVNVYSGLVEKTITPSGRVFDFDVSDDGAFLYLIRSGEGEGFVDVVDLETQEVASTLTYAVDRLLSRDSQDITFGRISNDPYLFTSTQTILDPDTGGVVNLSGESFSESLSVKNNVFCAASDSSVFGCFDMLTAGFEGARITAANRGGTAEVSGQRVLTRTGDKLFAFANRTISVLDTSDLSVLATVPTDPDDFVENMELDPSNNLVMTFRNDGFVPTDPSQDMIDESRLLTVFDAELNELSTVVYPDLLGGINSSSSYTTLSGDGQRVVYLIDEGSLEVAFFSLD